jgi:hypothetical protein
MIPDFTLAVELIGMLAAMGLLVFVIGERKR